MIDFTIKETSSQIGMPSSKQSTSQKEEEEMAEVEIVDGGDTDILEETALQIQVPSLSPSSSAEETEEDDGGVLDVEVVEEENSLTETAFQPRMYSEPSMPSPSQNTPGNLSSSSADTASASDDSSIARIGSSRSGNSGSSGSMASGVSNQSSGSSGSSGSGDRSAGSGRSRRKSRSLREIEEEEEEALEASWIETESRIGIPARNRWIFVGLGFRFWGLWLRVAGLALVSLRGVGNCSQQLNIPKCQFYYNTLQHAAAHCSTLHQLNILQCKLYHDTL